MNRLPARIAERITNEVPPHTSSMDLGRWMLANFPGTTPQEYAQAIRVKGEMDALAILDRPFDFEMMLERVI